MTTGENSWRRRIGWLPVILLPLLTIAFRERRPYVFMWLLVAAIFAGCKWQTWWEASVTGRIRADWKRHAAYLLLWPGMETREFFNTTAPRVPPIEWSEAMGKTLAGIALIGVGARVVFLGHPMWAAGRECSGWCCFYRLEP